MRSLAFREELTELPPVLGDRLIQVFGTLV